MPGLSSALLHFDLSQKAEMLILVCFPRFAVHFIEGATRRGQAVVGQNSVHERARVTHPLDNDPRFH